MGAWSQLELSKLEAFKAEIQGEIAKGELNKAKVELFTAQHQGLMTQVSVYKTQVEASLAELEVGKQNLEAVSYTHLDVYKRQGLYSMSFPTIDTELFLDSGRVW